MISVLTSNTQGGIIQFTQSFSTALRNLGESVEEWYPEGCEGAPISARHYSHVKQSEVLLGIPARVKQLADEICPPTCEMLICTDDVLGSSVIGELAAEKTRTFLVIHDAEPHPTNSMTARQKVRKTLNDIRKKRAYRGVEGLILLSNNSRNQFKKLYPKLANKTYLLPLCPHPVNVEPAKPVELDGIDCSKGFYLFFGRIDKYKGIGHLLKAYRSLSEKPLPLVIAGSGQLTEGEMRTASEIPELVLINRFIEDAELPWLFGNSSVVVLPYIEASQSGVLAMAYHYGKPVIVSNLPGLTEFVDDGKTGVIVNDENELAAALKEMVHSENFSQYVEDYRNRHLDWETNVELFLSQVRNEADAQ